MADQAAIINRALTKLGAKRITGITDIGKNAACMLSLWDTVRQAELRRNFWAFAISRTSLAALATAPSWGFGTAYQLPADYLRLIQVNDLFIAPSMQDYRDGDDSAYAIEGQTIATDFSAPLKIRYVRDIADPGLFDALFVETLAAKLAYEACEELTNSNSKRDAAMKDYVQALREAVKAGAIERPPQGLPDDSWMIGRL